MRSHIFINWRRSLLWLNSLKLCAWFALQQVSSTALLHQPSSTAYEMASLRSIKKVCVLPLAFVVLLDILRERGTCTSVCWAWKRSEHAKIEANSMNDALHSMLAPCKQLWITILMLALFMSMRAQSFLNCNWRRPRSILWLHNFSIVCLLCRHSRSIISSMVAAWRSITKLYVIPLAVVFIFALSEAVMLFANSNCFMLWQKCIHLFRSRWFSLPGCLLPESVGPNVLFHQQSKRVALDDRQKCTLCYQNTMSPGQEVKINTLLSQRGVI